MDREGFIEFVQQTFVEDKRQQGGDTLSRYRNHSLLTLECDCAILAHGLYKPASTTPETCSLSLDWTRERTRRSVVCAVQSMDCLGICTLRP